MYRKSERIVSLTMMMYFESAESYLVITGLSCGDPGDIHGASKTGGVLYEDIMTYTCLPGYNMTRGDAILSCGSDQTWKGTKPTCRSK